MPTERQQLEATIAGLESQRALLGDSLVDTAVAPLRAKLASLLQAHPAATADSVGQQLKQVSVLFLDIVGSTAMSQLRDPEEVHVIMDKALERFTALVQQHQGRVLKYMGDGLLAVFGSKEVQEDDAERCVLAGLALLDEAQRYAVEVRQRHGVKDFEIRVGVHTGPVLLGGGVDSDSSIRGMTVNIAARMEQATAPGSLRISHDSYRQVRGVFEVELQPPLTVKGHDAPISTYRVLRAKPRAFRVETRGIEGVETRMVGRDAELNVLQDAFRVLHGKRGFDAVTVVAEAGIGKSRLLHEFENWVESRPEPVVIFRARAQPQMQSQPYGLLREIMASRLQMVDGDSMAEARQKIERGVAPLFAHDDGADLSQAHLLGHLIGLDFADSQHIKSLQDDGAQMRQLGFDAAAQVVRRVAAQSGRPVLILLDDLHWADDASLDFLAYLAQVSADVPMLVLMLTRPSLFDRRADRLSQMTGQRIELGPLGKGLSQELAGELLKKLPAVPGTLRELITRGAEGNPFYMEELVKMLVDEGAIAIDAGQWRVIPDKLHLARVPQTLTGVLQARLDALQPGEKLALQQASVIGPVFWDKALAAIGARSTEALSSLVQREMCVPRLFTSLDGMREYAFKHQILHQVTYDTLLKRIRRLYHAQVAALLAGLTGARANDFLGATAEHFDKAGDKDNASEFYARAAEHAARRFAHEVTMGFVTQGLATLGDGEGAHRLAVRWRLLDVRERTLDLQGKRAEQRADIAELTRLAELMDDDRRRAEVAWRSSVMAHRAADFRTMERFARNVIALAERAGDEVLKLRGQHRLAVALINLGDTATGKLMAQDGLAAARADGLWAIEVLFLNTLILVASMHDDYVAVVEIGQRLLQIVRQIGNRRSEAFVLGNLGVGWFVLGEDTQSQRCLDEGLRLTRAVGNRASESFQLNGLSQLALRRGEHELALAHARAAVSIAVEVQYPKTQVLGLWDIGNAELALGHPAQAAVAYERAHALAKPIDHIILHDITAGLARVALACGDLAAAQHHVEDVLAYLAGGGTLQGREAPALIRLTCYQVLARVADPRAIDVLTGAYRELQSRAAAIADEALRLSFLDRVPEHRAILTAWATHAAGAPDQGSKD